MAPLSHTYLDYYPGDGPDGGVRHRRPADHREAYGFDPLDGVPPEVQARILGTQCQLWTEYIPTTRRLDYMMFPRACAHARWPGRTRRAAPGPSSSRGWPPTWNGWRAMGVEYRPEDGPAALAARAAPARARRELEPHRLTPTAWRKSPDVGEGALIMDGLPAEAGRLDVR